MRSLVVLFALVAVAVAAPSESAKKRSIGHVAVAYGLPSAVSHQSRVDVLSSPSVVAHAPVEYVEVSEPVVAARTVAVHHSPAFVTSYAAPVVAQQVVQDHSVYAPVAGVYSAPTAVSHQSRIDFKSSPAVVSEHVVSPAVFDAHSVYAPSVYPSYW